MQKLLGLALIIGGFLVGGIVVWLMALYVGEGLLDGVTAVIGTIFGMLLLALPQFILGGYLLYAN